MSKEKPSLPKGTRDFGPEEMKKRTFILENITRVFRKFGFNQIQTPSLENLSVLTGKYGTEGDQLLFKVLNSGDFLKGVEPDDLGKGYQHMIPLISNKGLRYDLTVPLARFVVMNQNDITFPFKRFQIQPVWRADKPQRGRYREFLQCDADVIGTNSLLCEAEIVQIIDEVLSSLGLEDFEIRINHREILSGISAALGPTGKNNEFAVIIDKIDKIGWENVAIELNDIGFTKDAIEKLEPLLNSKGSNDEILNNVSTAIAGGDNQGIQDLKEIISLLAKSGWKKDVLKVDPSLARGLAYYTGTIFEVITNGVKIGSLAGGGRYDDLTGIFGLPNIPATGISFGVDRIYDVLEELNLFKEISLESPSILIVHFDNKSFDYGLSILSELHANGITSEVYPDLAKPKKQLTYANKKNIDYVILIGEEEITTGLLSFKDMTSGEQQKLKLKEIIALVKDA